MASASSSRTSSPSLHRRRRRSSTADSHASNQEYSYAQPDNSISEWLKCPICLNPFVEPIQASSCEHIFCKGCINLHLTATSNHGDDRDAAVENDSHSCPSCRSPISQKHLKPAAALIRNMVDSLLVKCPHEKRGCPHTCERSFVDAHARRDCGWAYVGEYSESNDGKKATRARCECGKKVLRKDWQAHIDSDQCSIVRVRCEHGCGTVSKESEMEEHLEICTAKPVNCGHCSIELPRGEMDQHEETCEEAIISCKLARFGCDWEGSKGHFASQHIAHCRLIPLEAYLLKQEKDVEVLRRDNTKLIGSIESLKLEQHRMMALVQQCVSCLGSSYIEEAAPSLLFRTSTNNERQQSTETVQSQGHTPPALDIVAMPPRPDFNTENDPGNFHHLVSTSAPASRAELPWQWPDPSAAYRSAAARPPPSSLATVSDSLSEVDKKLSSVFEQLKQVDRKMEDNHILGLNANFEANRAHEELNSVRHGLHALRISLLMQQQRGMPGNAFMTGQGPVENRVGDNGTPNVGPPNAMPFATGLGPSMMGLRRFWTGFEQTKL